MRFHFRCCHLELPEESGQVVEIPSSVLNRSFDRLRMTIYIYDTTSAYAIKNLIIYPGTLHLYTV